MKTYKEAKEHILWLNTPDTWVFEAPNSEWFVIHDFQFKHYCSLGWIPRAQLKHEPKLIEMFTGVVL